ncbi:MAG: radical SAM protein [Candidatus Helarchaeales archaeon]
MTKIRLSMATAATLKFFLLKMDAVPTTAYLMIYDERKCLANCLFCPQARESKTSKDMLSRIRWPEFELSEVLDRLERFQEALPFKRICIQTINVPGMYDALLDLIKKLKTHSKIPISVACHPLKENQLRELRDAGVDRLGIPLDASNETLFNKIKGKKAKSPYDWEKHLNAIKMAQKMLGKNKISTHLIVGLGETEKEAIKFIQDMMDMGVLVGLFAFTPIPGTPLESHPQPPLDSYRRIQLARFLIVSRESSYALMRFNSDGRVINYNVPRSLLTEIISSGKPFQTSGCPGCNRPFYNERPGKNLYNYPYPLNEENLKFVKESLKEFLHE